MKVYLFLETFMNFARKEFELYQNHCRLLQKTAKDRNRICPQTNYLFMFLLKVLNQGTCGHAHKVPALITKIQITHNHNNNPASTPSSHYTRNRLEMTHDTTNVPITYGFFSYSSGAASFKMGSEQSLL